MLEKMASDGKFRSRQSSSDTSSEGSTENALAEYVNSFSKDEIDVIANSSIRNPKSQNLFKKFVRLLKQQPSKESPETLIKRDISLLRDLEHTYLTKHTELTELLSKFTRQGENVIQVLQTNSAYLDTVVKGGILFRLVGSAVDTVGTVSGLMLKKTGSEHAGHAFQSASLFGILGLLSTVGEVAISKRLLSEVMSSLEDYQEQLEKINSWFRQTKKLDELIQRILPYGIDVNIVKEVQEDSSSLDDYIKIFKAGFVSNVRRDKNLFKDEDFYWKLDLFSKSQTAVQWWKWVIFREHPIVLDFARMKLQNDCDPNGSILFQSIPALPLEQQRLMSLPVGGRIVLNMLTIYDAVSDLRCGAKFRTSEKMRKLLNDIIPQMKTLSSVHKLMHSKTDSENNEELDANIS